MFEAPERCGFDVHHSQHHRARRRGWITASTSAAELSVSVNASPRAVAFRWRTEDDDKLDAERAEVERLEATGHEVVSVGWANAFRDKTIEHNPSDAVEEKPGVE
jgi:hypothetical protein